LIELTVQKEKTSFVTTHVIGVILHSISRAGIGVLIKKLLSCEKCPAVRIITFLFLVFQKFVRRFNVPLPTSNLLASNLTLCAIFDCSDEIFSENYV